MAKQRVANIGSPMTAAGTVPAAFVPPPRARARIAKCKTHSQHSQHSHLWKSVTPSGYARIATWLSGWLCKMRTRASCSISLMQPSHSHKWLCWLCILHFSLRAHDDLLSPEFQEHGQPCPQRLSAHPPPALPGYWAGRLSDPIAAAVDNAAPAAPCRGDRKTQPAVAGASSAKHRC